MNPKFYNLPSEKQTAIINAGYKIFSRNSYRNSPVGEVANAAKISKSLLFFYFKNKKELYLFLLEYLEKVTMDELKKQKVTETDDLFEAMYQGLMVKFEIMKNYPDLSNFSLKAFYENDDEVKDDIKKIFDKYAQYKENKSIIKINPEKLKDGLDPAMVYRDIYLASEGFVYEKSQLPYFDVDAFVEEYKQLIAFWKKVYMKE